MSKSNPSFREKFYKFKKKTEKLLDPFLVMALLLVFAIPAVTVLNLTPDWDNRADNQPNVLGTTDQTNLSLIPYQSLDQGLQVTEVNQTTETSYSLTVENLPHERGTFTNEIFEIANPTETQKQFAIEPSFKNVPEGTKVSIMLDNVKHVMLDSDGTSYPVGVYLQGGEQFPVYIVVESANNVNYVSNFLLDVNLEV
jgi:hypothetical protein